VFIVLYIFKERIVLLILIKKRWIIYSAMVVPIVKAEENYLH